MTRNSFPFLLVFLVALNATLPDSILAAHDPPLDLCGGDGSEGDGIASDAERLPGEPEPQMPEPREPLSEWKRWLTRSGSPIQATYSRKGLEIASQDDHYRTRIQWRLQLRNAFPFDAAPRSPLQMEKKDETSFGFRRARLKVGGHAYRSWFNYYLEHDLVNNRLLTFRATIKKNDWLHIRVGQWKANYNRERVDSSGKQQFAERSIVNREFTIDRQKGVLLMGHLMPGTRGDSWYYAGVFTGTGRGLGADDDGSPMWMGRYQWNFLGRDLGFSQSDLEYHEEPAASVSFAALTNRSRFTRFSGSGGGQLDGFEAGAPGQYFIKQMMVEAALKYRGFSLQHEYHWKQIVDHVNAATTRLTGSYAQAGYFLHHLIPASPKQLEVAFRYAFVDPNLSHPGDLRQEYTVAFNWFFEGHGNKLTFDLSRLSLGRLQGSDAVDTRTRLQWDVSF